MGNTTIPCSREVKAKIDAEKKEGETYNGTLLRLIETYESAVTESEAREIANEQIAERVLSEAQR